MVDVFNSTTGRDYALREGLGPYQRASIHQRPQTLPPGTASIIHLVFANDIPYYWPRWRLGLGLEALKLEAWELEYSSDLHHQGSNDSFLPVSSAFVV